MNSTSKLILGLAVIAATTGITAACHHLWRIARIGTAYTAKTLCSGVFVSKREPDSILDTDIRADNHPLLSHIRARVDSETQSVTASLYGMAERKAVFRPGLGCTVVSKGYELGAPSLSASHTAAPVDTDLFWPDGERVDSLHFPSDIDPDRLREAVESAFSETDPTRLHRTRAVVIVHKGRIIVERYADGFTKDTPLLGWSMTKSVINALTGILVQGGKLSLDDRVLAPEWSNPGDPRGQITVRHLLHMTSGLRFDEHYKNPLKDVTVMLLAAPDKAAFAAGKPLVSQPGGVWHYSSGTTNILSRALRAIVGGTDANYADFPRKALFDRIGMQSAVMEADATGVFVGSSFMYATARDWARFGLLYLQDGVWQGERILPEGWVEYSRTPIPQSPAGEYGAHFWLRLSPVFRGTDGNPVHMPADTFHAIGHEGQFVTIIPSRDLVIVRLGLARRSGSWNHEAFVGKVLEAVPA
jgi:CubicO group peptidase (beta-lactamase class C family)